MTGGLFCLAAAALAWPPPGSVHRSARLMAQVRHRRWSGGALSGGRPATAMAGAAALVVGAVLSTLVVAVLAGGSAVLGTRALQARRRGSAARRQVDALAEALGVVAAELRAGRSVDDAAGTAVAGCPDPAVAAALGPVLRLGVDPDSAMSGETDETLTRVSCAVRLSARTGCSLAAVVSAVEDDLRARARAEAELRAAVAGPRASASVLAGLPVLGLLMGSGVGADPWRVLTTTGTGTALLVAGVALEGAGLAWSDRLVRRAVRR